MLTGYGTLHECTKVQHERFEVESTKTCFKTQFHQLQLSSGKNVQITLHQHFLGIAKLYIIKGSQKTIMQY